MAQAAELLEIAVTRDGPKVLAGDSNMFVGSDIYEAVAAEYTDVLKDYLEVTPSSSLYTAGLPEAQPVREIFRRYK